MNSPQETNSIETWLDHEDESGRAGRLDRLKWLTDNSGDSRAMGFQGGLLMLYQYEEARYCFVYGQYLATIILGLAAVERMLGAMFFMSGRNDLERASLSQLTKEALDAGWLEPAEHESIDCARETRNKATHFRRPGEPDSYERRALLENTDVYSVIEADAKAILLTMLHLTDKLAW